MRVVGKKVAQSFQRVVPCTSNWIHFFLAPPSRRHPRCDSNAGHGVRGSVWARVHVTSLLGTDVAALLRRRALVGEVTHGGGRPQTAENHSLDTNEATLVLEKHASGGGSGI